MNSYENVKVYLEYLKMRKKLKKVSMHTDSSFQSLYLAFDKLKFVISMYGLFKTFQT